MTGDDAASIATVISLLSTIPFPPQEGKRVQFTVLLGSPDLQSMPSPTSTDVGRKSVETLHEEYSSSRPGFCYCSSREKLRTLLHFSGWCQLPSVIVLSTVPCNLPSTVLSQPLDTNKAGTREAGAEGFTR